MVSITKVEDDKKELILTELVAISSRMTCVCNQESCSWNLSGCKYEPGYDPSSNYYWANSWVPGPYETQKANLARAKEEFGLCKAKYPKKNETFLGYTKRYNGHDLTAKGKLYCQSAKSEGCEQSSFNFKGLLLKEKVQILHFK